MIKNRKIGRFIINMRDINKCPIELKRLFYHILIIKAEYLFDVDGIEYTGISEYFDELKEGQMSPQYDFIFDSKKPYFIKAEKI